MNIRKSIIALIITTALFYQFYSQHQYDSSSQSITDNGFQFDFDHVGALSVGDKAEIKVTIAGEFEAGVKPVIRISKFAQDSTTNPTRYRTSSLLLVDSSKNLYSYTITADKKGRSIFYYFEVRDNTGGRRALVMDQPDITSGRPIPFQIRTFGEYNSLAKYGYFIFLFLALLTSSCAFINSFVSAPDLAHLARQKRALLASTFSILVGGMICKAIYLNSLLGLNWSAYPIDDSTIDNAIQNWFLFTLFLSIISAFLIKTKKHHKLLFTQSAFNKLTMLLVFFFVFPYLFPFGELSMEDPIEMFSSKFPFVLLSVLLISFFGLFKSKSK